MTDKRHDVTIEESSARVKVILPIQTNWLLLILYTFSLIVWLAMLVAILVYLFQGRSSSIVLTLILIIWMVIWLLFGRFLANRWQYHLARREILFIDDDQLILRRPVSIFGLTTTYDRSHVSPFYFSDRHECPAFDYAFVHVYFGQSLNKNHAYDVVAELNRICFPEVIEDELAS